MVSIPGKGLFQGKPNDSVMMGPNKDERKPVTNELIPPVELPPPVKLSPIIEVPPPVTNELTRPVTNEPAPTTAPDFGIQNAMQNTFGLTKGQGDQMITLLGQIKTTPNGGNINVQTETKILGRDIFAIAQYHGEEHGGTPLGKAGSIY